MFDRALIPLDGSTQFATILPYVARFAGGLNMPLVLASVLAPGPTATLEQRRQEADGHLQEIVARLTGTGVEATAVVAVGRPVQEMVRLVEQEGCNLILLLPRGEGAQAWGALGSITEKVLQASPVPILTIPSPAAAPDRSEGAPITTVIVPLDGSSLAEMALPYAEELAQQLAADVILTRAVSANIAYIGAMMDTPFISPRAMETTDEEAADYLKRVADKLRAEGFAVQAQLLRTQPAPGIVALAQQTPHSLIALTTHGRSALARWFMGSVAEEVVETAETPVLVIPQHYSQLYTLKIADLLAQTPLFAELTQEELQRLADAARLRAYQPGEVIVREGEQTAGCFIILTGQVEVVKDVDTAKSTVLARLGPGEIFGEMAMIDDHPRSATVRAIEATECVGLRRSDFMAELQRTPEIAVHMLPVLVRRLREARTTAVE
jgi:nucleotide-binding universal stress UspA family protein